MNYSDFERVLSSARVSKYANACNNNKARTMMLYQYNIKLCQRFYGVIGMFEVLLRNAINNHYTAQFADNDWIIHQCSTGQLLEQEVSDIKKKENEFQKSGVYSPDKMVAAFSFGFWTYFFTKRNYKVGNKTLLKIFPLKKKGLKQKDIYKDLNYIREFRNRIAHNEPICFDNNHNISTSYCRTVYTMICDYISFMGESPESILKMVEKPDAIMRKVDNI